MKAELIAIDGSKKGSIELPKIFESDVRMDLIKRAYDAEQSVGGQPYGAFYLAGKLVSASGKIKHARSGYRSHYGKGISRVPRKTMNRRGARRMWVGAFAPGTRGGRPAHPPKVEKNNLQRINKKEKNKAISSAIAATAKNRILVIETKFTEMRKSKEILQLLHKITNESKSKDILFITDKEMKLSNLGIDSTTVKRLLISDLAPCYQLRKVVIWTEKAVEEIGAKK